MAGKNRDKKLVLWFKELDINDVPFVGGKNASLGEMYQSLTKKGIKIPYGFATTAVAYWQLLKFNNAEKKLKSALRGISAKNVKSLSKAGQKCRDIIMSCEFPDELTKEIIDAYKKLSKISKIKNVDVAVRSSATAEDLPTASFAGQQETFLNITGERALLEAVKKCFASLFTNRAISYRIENKFDHMKVALSVGVQRMVRSDLSSSGVMFSIDTETGFKDAVFINGSYGLGESVVQGLVNPDEFYIFKPTLKQGYHSLISKKLGSKAKKIVYSNDSHKPVKQVLTPESDRDDFCISDLEALKLSKWAVIIEDHYSKKHKKFTPMDMEWAKDGKTGELFIVQARPETVQSQKDVNVLEEYKLLGKGKLLCEGKSVGTKIGQGRAHIIKDIKDVHKFKPGQILVTEMTDPDWVVVMRQANAIVTDKGGRTCFSKDVKILTKEGFLNFEDVFKKFCNGESFSILSFDYETQKTVWRNVEAVMQKRAPLWKIQISPTLRSKQNFLEVTPEHKFLTLENRKIIKKELKTLLNKKEGILVPDKIPMAQHTILKENEAYLLGALLSDGYYSKNKQGGYVVGFSQKIIPEKQAFINAVCSSFETIYNKKPKCVLDSRSNTGAFQCYSKEIYYDVKKKYEMISKLILSIDEPNLLRFLAGIIDGDGNVSHHQVQITISEQNKPILEAVILASYRVGIIPSICRRKNWYILSFTENIDKLLLFTKRVKMQHTRQMPIKRFLAKQVIGDIINDVNKRGKIKYSYLLKDNMLTEKKIRQSILPHSKANKEIEQILKSDFYMQRANFEEALPEQNVYDLTVSASEELNHNYIVFTTNFTPIIVSNCHAAIVSRELGIPCVVGTINATEIIKNKKPITVSCSEGEEGRVYEGKLKFKIDKISLKNIPKTKTKIMMNIGNPDEAFELSFLPNDGVGLAREEFIINEYIKIHPLALLNFKELKDKEVRDKIKKLTVGYDNKSEFFVEKLAFGIAMIAAAFYPKPVIVRLSDFKSNEYRNLIGGKYFEPKEENPMLGWRGASRYYSDDYEKAFALECKAINRVRKEFGLKNVKVMIPMCRTIDEGKKVLKVMFENGLKQHMDGLEVYVMCEVPSNVILADDFAKIFDGFSIGSNDLTQLTLGIDRDSELISHLFDERNPAVLKMIAEVIRVARKNNKKIGICGDAASSFEDFTKFLVENNIDSMSLTPDAIIKVRMQVAKLEKG